jgi:hypothetical protein
MRGQIVIPEYFSQSSSQFIDKVCQLNTDNVAFTKGKGLEAGEKELTRWRTMPGWLVVTCSKS